MIGALLVQHTAATEVMSLKVEFLLEPPKVWQQDIDTEVRKCTSCISSKESTDCEMNFQRVHQDEEDEQNEMHSRVALSSAFYPVAVGFAAISLAGKVTDSDGVSSFRLTTTNFEFV